MKHQLSTRIVRQLLALLIAASPALALPALAGQVALATSPLATSSTSSVSPNIMYMLDDSGSMDWDYMPDTALNFAGKYGYNSAQCNGVAYNPGITYLPPVDSSGTSYPNSSFTAAVNDGFAGAAASGTTNLSTSYPGSSGTGAPASNPSNLATPQAAYYYIYKGTQTTPYQQNYYNTSSTFYKECNSSFGTTPGTSIGSAPGVSVFTYVKVSSTSGPGATDERTNFANWFSYYSTRMMMMKTGVGQAFKGINPSYRVGFMTMNNNVSPDFINILPFTGGCTVGSGTCQKDQFYTKLYQANPGSSTPLRQTLSQIGNLYANKYATTYTYTATITVGGSTTSSTSVTSVASGPSGCISATATTSGPCFQLMNAPSAPVSSGTNRNNKIATAIAGQINTQNTLYTSVYQSASASGSVVTITGDAADFGTTPVVTATGGGTFTVTSFVKNTVVAKLNNVVPLDPIQYSCQKNFVILSTDGYWNGNAGYDLNGNMVGNQDGTAPRPYYDGAVVSQTTSQVSMTQTTMAQSTSQIIQPHQSRTSNLVSTSYPLQKTTAPLIKTSNPLQQTATPLIKTSNPLQQTATPLIKTSNPLQQTAYPLYSATGQLQKATSTNSGSTWSAWSNVTSCAWVTTGTNRTKCQYLALGAAAPAGSCTYNVNSGTSGTWNTEVVCSYGTPTVSTVASCTVSAKSSSTTNGTVYNASAADCAYTTSGQTVTNPAGSCTVVNSPGPTNYSGPQVLCSYGSAVVSTVTSCSLSAQSSGSANGTVYNAAAVTGCAYTTTGQTVTNPAGSCTVVNSAASPYTGPQVLCSYGSAVVSTVTTCSLSAQSSGSANGTVYNAAAVTGCAYTTTGQTVTNPAGTCTVVNSAASPYTGPQVLCSYGTPVVSTVTSCTTSAQSSGSANGTVYNAAPASCAYGAGVVTYPSTCTNVAQSPGPTNYSGPAVACSWSGWTAYAGVNSCTAAAQDTTNPYDMTATAGVATQCLSNVPVASCAPSTSCTTNSTGPTYVTSTGGNFNCTPGNSGSPNYIDTICANNNVFGPAYVASCTAADASSADSYVMTTCNPTSTTVGGLTSCTGQVPTASNNYTTISCSASSGGTSDTLADTAMYYYQTDLRTPALGNCTGALGSGTNVCDNNVPISGTDTNPAQHVTTFSLGIGTRGQMVYSSTYNTTDTSGDYFSVAQGLTADSTQTPPVCSWQSNGTTCNWPVPVSNTYTNIDDLWHAAVNGRGSYFAATDPNTLAKGLASTLAAIEQKTGAAAAAATSTLNPVTGNNYAYVASYTTVKWTGNLEQRTIDVTNGNVSTSASWCVENIAPPTCPSGQIIADTSGSSTVYYCSTPATDVNGDGSIDALDCTAPQVFDSATTACKAAINNTCVGTLPTMVGPSSDTRTIYTANSTGTALIPFDASYAAANPANFSAAHISGLSQWSTLTTAQQTAAAGTNLINYLRGQNGYEENRTSNPVANWLYRDRSAVMGDALESQPTFIAAPTFSYSDPGYSNFVATQTSLPRPGTVYIGTNDGMLHAFAASNGVERWAYVPSVVIPKMWHLADFNYGSQHVNFVNGSPVVSDICTANCTNAATAVWRTVIVGGLNAGGREYYALDITDPTAPSLLWEFTPTMDANLGYSYGRPVVTKLQNGTWVVLVSSGYDNGTLSADGITANSPTGDGMGHLYVLNAATGAIISNISDLTGSAATPSGFAKFNAYSAVAGTNQAGLVYGGDLLGNVWRFNVNSPAAAGTNPFTFAVLKDPSGATQPVTVAPTLGAINGVNMIFVGTGKYLETADLGTTQVQTIYGIEDNNVTTTFTNPAGSPRNSTTLVQQTLSAVSNSVRTDTNNAVSMPPAFGWYVDLPDTGERANVDFQLVQGTLLVPTIVPSNTACSPGGYGYFNFFNYQTGGPPSLTSNIVSQYYNSPIVGMNVLYIGGQPMVEIVTSNNPTPTPPPSQPPFQKGSGGFTQTREVWRELMP